MNQASNVKKRVEWVDFAKAVAIAAVIFGHCLPLGVFSRSFIYSFHIPMFFILSGYTMRFAENLPDALRRIGKDIKHLIVPYLILSVANAILLLLARYFVNHQSAAELLSFMKKYLYSTFLGNGNGIHRLDYTTPGVLWFLIALFWARSIVHLVGAVTSLKGKNQEHKYVFSYVILFGIGFLGMYMGSHQICPPAFLDTALVAVLFLAVGMLAHLYSQKLSAIKLPLFVVCFLLWVYTLLHGKNIDFIFRQYPYYGMIALVAVGATYVICVICGFFCKTKYIKKPVLFIGQNTLIILGIHYLEMGNISTKILWNHGVWWQAALLRVLIDVIAGMIVAYLWQRIKRSRNENITSNK